MFEETIYLWEPDKIAILWTYVRTRNTIKRSVTEENNVELETSFIYDMYRLDILCESFFFLFRRKRRAEEFCIDSDRREINCSLRPQIHFRFWFLISLSFDFWFAYKTFCGTTIVPYLQLPNPVCTCTVKDMNLYRFTCDCRTYISSKNLSMRELSEKWSYMYMYTFNTFVLWYGLSWML